MCTWQQNRAYSYRSFRNNEVTKKWPLWWWCCEGADGFCQYLALYVQGEVQAQLWLEVNVPWSHSIVEFPDTCYANYKACSVISNDQTSHVLRWSRPIISVVLDCHRDCDRHVAILGLFWLCVSIQLGIIMSYGGLGTLCQESYRWGCFPFFFLLINMCLLCSKYCFKSRCSY